VPALGANSLSSLRESERATLAQRSGVITRLSNLPPFHSTALRLLTVRAESDSAPRDFELAFQADSALACRLLLVVNAPPYGYRGRVESIRQAIDLMGMEGVRSLVLTLAIGSYMRGAQTAPAARSVWHHSLATAVIAETIGAAVGEEVPFLYTAGLLHDVGRMALLSIERERYSGVLQRMYFDLDESLLLEDMLFGCAHDDAGAFLGRSWGMPQQLCDCIGSHHQPEGSGMLQQIVQLACSTAGSLGMGELQCEDHVEAPRDGELGARLAEAAAMRPDRLLFRIRQITEALANVGVHPAAGGAPWKTS